MRPLLQPGTRAGTSSAKISREHTVASPVPGLTVIAGGKLTTHRVMAEDAVDFALGDAQARRLPSITERIRLVGAEGHEVLRRRSGRIAAHYGWSEATVDHLLHRYGALLTDLTDLVDAQPDLGRPLELAPASLRAEVDYAAADEGVLHLEDVMVSRTRMVYEQSDKGLGAVPEIADLVAERLGWSAERRAAEIAAYRSRCEAQDRAVLQLDDAAAEAEQSRATDLAPLVPMAPSGVAGS